ncbi:MAG: general secretion pathway protein GspK [Phycisphaerae bacterium]|nr:general secretion pathway protein GspK [Phycisphaerae bacterium]
MMRQQMAGQFESRSGFGPTHDRRARGTVLIVTIWVVLVLAGLALVFARSMRVSASVAANHVASLQAECLAGGALQYVVAKITEAADAEEDEAGLDDSDDYEEREVGEEGFFWVLSSNLESDREFAYGLTDEAGKINLNSASVEMLQKLPGMTAELAASIVDWRDSDTDVTTSGAESEYYLLQADGYQCKNAPLETVDEILLIKGATEELLYGEDTNLNGYLDDHENDGDESEPDDNHNGNLDAGFYDYVTVYSVEQNVDADGGDRVDISDASAVSDLQTLLEETFKQDRALEIVMTSGISSNPSYENILDFYYRSGMTLDEFSQIADKLTTSSEVTLTGMVNVNTAPKEVLACLPNLENSDAESLVAYRESHSDKLGSIAWVTQVLDQEKAVGIGSYITVRSYQYSADIVCVSANGRAYKRYRAVLDTQGDSPRVVYWRSLTHFGWPLQPEILDALKKGQPLTSVVLSMH